MKYNPELKFVYLLERCAVPLHLGPRGHGPTKYFYVPPKEHLKPYEYNAMVELRKLIPSTDTIIEIPIYYTQVPFDLKPIQAAVSKHEAFSGMDRSHLQASFALTEIFLSQHSEVDLFNACALARDAVNTHLWVHAFYRAALQSPLMKGFRLPCAWEVMPDMFVEGKVWNRAVMEAVMPEPFRAIITIDKNFTGTNLDPNHKVAYFREDIGLNSHHWHWHTLNPASAPKGSIDRHGEIFYYMHHGVLARYDAERLSNGLNRVVPYDIHNDFMEEAYFSKLTMQNSALEFSDRQENTMIRDFFEVLSAKKKFVGLNSLANIRAWFDRIIEAVDAGFAFQDDGSRISLRTERGIDIVTAMWEASNDTPNENYYGIPHNYGHSAIGRIHDPDSRYRAPPGVMHLTSTAMRDTIFFRWHRYLDLISQRQKDFLPPYAHENLQWNGVIVNDIRVVRVEPSRVPMPNLERVNTLVTHWMQSDIELSRGLDFGRTNINGLGSVWVRATHLQQVPFVYRIRVTSQLRTDVQATVRIFMAPKLDENNDKLPFFQQRILFFEMDKFTTTLHPGENVITQKSEDSTLTIPWSQTFRDVERDTDSLTRAQAICGCGWPDHLLLPRGKLEGMPFDLFVMLTNTQVDQVPGAKRHLGTLNAKGTCRDSISFCGMLDDKFPDSRPMGYPFDRPAVPNEKATPNMFLLDFVKTVSNMAISEVNIIHINKTIVRGNGAPDGLREIMVSP